jgi:hypothetical protein
VVLASGKRGRLRCLSGASEGTYIWTEKRFEEGEDGSV